MLHRLQMGVGAVFISTLALTELPTPHNPPQNQEELLALYIQPVVAFVVLGSIIIHGLSIPFFSFGRRIHTRTLSLTATLTGQTNIPDWLSWTRSRSPVEPSASTIIGVERNLEAGENVVVTSARPSPRPGIAPLPLLRQQTEREFYAQALQANTSNE
ncbi:hypothetical protein D9757_004300 [Collybiopsis confluens]|uniref:Uncharacterized protein n=1 Tax=Collybiopsis confluens TaxID=2823264 RepID=A0A8H5MD10_9AGAR|nr:hypothetical protein D9757_004300 [Collybiopsis confluens]